jgi:hypothetical protein
MTLYSEINAFFDLGTTLRWGDGVMLKLRQVQLLPRQMTEHKQALKFKGWAKVRLIRREFGF